MTNKKFQVTAQRQSDSSLYGMLMEAASAKEAHAKASAAFKGCTVSVSAIKRGTSTYDTLRDQVVLPVQVIWLDEVTGARVNGPGEGATGFCFATRTMFGPAEGETQNISKPVRLVAGPTKISGSGAFVSKKDSTQAKWTVDGNGRASLSGTSPAGTTSIGAKSGRMTPPVMATYSKMLGAYAAKVAAHFTASASRKAS